MSFKLRFKYILFKFINFKKNEIEKCLYIISTNDNKYEFIVSI